MSILRTLVERLMTHDLRRAFRTIYWTGDPPGLPPDTPVILYANHHHFYDGHLLWLVIRRMLHRRPLTWMADWDRFPLFGPVGALPFPPDDSRRRAATIRHTARLFREQPAHMLVYFPEGHLHAPEDGIQAFDTLGPLRLNRFFPDACWWPVGIHVTWRGHDRPVAFLGGGTPHTTATGYEYEHLRTTWHTVRKAEVQEARLLLDGRPSPHERWRLSWLRYLIRPYS